MKLYIENFKGFRKEIIELEDVNFIVGENSTGKTSILKLINILSSQEFWFKTEFNNNEVELGYFDEIHNKMVEEKLFRIGFEKTYKVQDEEKVKRMVFEFTEQNNVPVITKVKSSSEKEDYLIKFSKKQIQFQTKSKEENFDKWVSDIVFVGKTRILKIPTSNIPLSLAIMIVEKEMLDIDVDFDDGRIGFRAYPLYPKYTWMAPIRAKAKRIYESYKIKFSPEGDHIPSLLRNLLSSKRKKQNQEIINTLIKFGRESNLFDNINITEFGRRNSSPFEIQVEYDGLPIKLTNVGYGVSQSLPLLVEILSSSKECFSIQQPEVHLHPKAQAAFGSFILNSFKTNKNTFLIETHSDYTINRYRYSLSKTNEVEEVKSQILFFQRTKEGNTISTIKIDSKGKFDKHLPEDYRNFFIDEELKLLEL